MRKIVNKIILLLVYLVLCVWAFELLLIIGAFIKDTKYKDIYIFSIVILISLVFLFLLRKLFFDNKKKFKDWKHVWKDWCVYEGDWDEKYWANWKWKLTWSDWSYYEWEFKNWKPHWMWIIKMKNWYYYEWEFSDWKRTWKFKKEKLTNWWIIEWKFRDNWNDGFDWIWKVVASNWFIFEWTFKNWKLSWEGKTKTPNWEILMWVFDKWELKTWKKILKNWEYSEWNWRNWYLTWKSKYYFKDGSCYEWECKDWNWIWRWTYITKKWDKYSTEFPYEIINIFAYWLNSKIREIDWDLNYIPLSEKEKAEEKDMALKILEKWTLLQKKIAKFSLELEEESENIISSLETDTSLNKFGRCTTILASYVKCKEKIIKFVDDNHIKLYKNSSIYSYWQYFYKLNHCYDIAILTFELFIEIYKFLNPENIFDLVIKREEKNKERVILINEFSDKYKEFIQSLMDWREYEKKFWKYNFKPDKSKK